MTDEANRGTSSHDREESGGPPSPDIATVSSRERWDICATDNRLTRQRLPLALATDLASRAASAVDHAQTHAAGREARKAAEASAALARDAHRVGEKVSRDSSDFLAFLSHELRTPLGALGAYAELLAMTASDTLSQEQQQYLSGIRRNHRQLVQIADDVVHYAEGQSGMVRYLLEDVELTAVLSRCEEVMASHCHASEVALQIDACDGPLRVHADADKLQRILVHLISNACKFTDPGGSVTLSCTGASDHVVEVAVDSGMSIADEHLERLFGPFVRASQSNTRTVGVDLGLAISRLWARGMGGDLTASSRRGRGSRFALSLPRG